MNSTYQRNYRRDILRDGEELYLVILDIFKINDEIKYSTKIVKTDFINNDYLEFDLVHSLIVLGGIWKFDEATADHNSKEVESLIRYQD